MARPKSDNPKDRNITVRFDAAMDSALDKVTKLEPDIDKSQHIRIAVRQYVEKKLGKKVG